MARVFTSSVIGAPPDQVWKRIRDFNGLPTWHPAIRESQIEGGEPSDKIGCIRDFYLQNERQLDDYYARTAAGELPLSRGVKLTQEDKLRRHIIMNLICQMHLDIRECAQQFGVDFHQHFNGAIEQLKGLEADQLLSISDAQIEVTEKGRPFLRNICMPFDAYLPVGAGGGESRGFSATL